MKRSVCYFVQNKICQQTMSTAAEPIGSMKYISMQVNIPWTKTKLMIIVRCGFGDESGDLNDLDLMSYVVRVEKFSLVGKQSTAGLNTTRTNAVSLAQLVQMLSSCKCPFQLHHKRIYICDYGFCNWKRALDCFSAHE